jgi:hypothetical protein
MSLKLRSPKDVPVHTAHNLYGQWVAGGVAVLALMVYTTTLAPGLTFEHCGTDGGDLIAAARTLGIPHPTGYPTYTLLAWLFSQLTVGTIAYRVNLMSAVCAALTVGLLCRIAQFLLPAEKYTLALSAAAALALAFSPMLWSQAVISEVYTLLTLFAATFLWLLLRWQNDGSDRLFLLAALVLGLGLGNHITLIFAAPAALVLLWPDRQRWFRLRTLAPAAILFFIGLGIYAYLPLAAIQHPPVNWGNPQTWKRFLWVVTAKQYQQFAFALSLEEVPGRLSSWAWQLGNQFGWWGLVIALAGAWWWWQRDRHFVLFVLTWIVPLVIYAFSYDTGDSYIYLLPALLLLALWWSEGARYLLRLVQRLALQAKSPKPNQRPRPSRKPQSRAKAWVQVTLAIAVLLPFFSLALHWQTMDLSDDWTASTYIYQTLQGIDPGSLVVVRGDRATFALWYAVYAEKQRPDMAIVSGPMLAYYWYRDHVRYLYPHLTLPEPTAPDVTTDDIVHDLIMYNYAHQPIYATDPKEEWETWFDFVKVEDTTIFRVQPKAKWEHEK